MFYETQKEEETFNNVEKVEEKKKSIKVKIITYTLSIINVHIYKYIIKLKILFIIFTNCRRNLTKRSKIKRRPKL